MNKLKALQDKRALFCEQRKKLLDTAIKAERLLTATEEVENKRLAAEIDRMDELIKYARSIPDDGPMGPLGPEPGPSGAGQAGRWYPRSGIRTAHRSLGELVEGILRGEDLRELRTMSMGVGAAGGVLVPEQLVETIFMVDPEGSIVRPRATPLPAPEGHPDAERSVPYLDHTKGAVGGLQVEWIAEGHEKPEHEPELAAVTLKPEEMAATVAVTDKLLRNSSTIGVFLDRAFREAMRAEEDFQFLCGDGIAKPQGVMNSPARIDVARTGAGAIVYADILAMVTRLMPGSWGKAAWVCSQSALPQILGLVDPAAAGTLLIRPSEITAGKAPPLLGMPLLISGRTPVLGARGDFMLCDFSYYLIAQGYGPVVAASPHPRFTSNQTIIKGFQAVDGSGWLQAPYVLENGIDTCSPFVILQ